MANQCPFLFRLFHHSLHLNSLDMENPIPLRDCTLTLKISLSDITFSFNFYLEILILLYLA